MIEESLKNLDFSGYEIKVYLTLVKHGNCKAKDISQLSGVPPTAVYPNLNLLIRKGLVQKIESKDLNVFEPLLPSIAFKALLQRKKEELKETGETITEELESMMNKETITPKKEFVNLSFGLEASANITKRFMIDAKESLYIFGWGFRSNKKLHSILYNIRNFCKKDLDIRIILTPTDATLKDLIASFKKLGVKVRFLPWGNFSIIVADSKECKFTLKNNELADRLNIHIQDNNLAKAMNEYFLSLWQKADKKL